MEIGIGLPNQVRDVRATVLPDWARHAEEAGFASLGTIGRIAYPGVMDTVALAAAAGATSRIKLLSSILLGTAWPPVLLAKEAAGIDAISGGRLRLGLGLGHRTDDFAAGERSPHSLGRRLEADLATYRDIWDGEPAGGGKNAAVPRGSRRVPLLFGGFARAALRRMARWGEGYVAGMMPIPMTAGWFDQARTEWDTAGRHGKPRLVAIAYFALGDRDAGRTRVRDYYTHLGDVADLLVNGILDTPAKIRAKVTDYASIGADELILHPVTDDPDEVRRLADAAL